ncbi:class I adenylate-forming enzyme family protein [Paraburkholderia phymatum]|uniref:AMP-dependent synthetase and ligase n=1 Tax=Paraburkholderia phymatum (strain DSM 17167 / CIP 108236 / LMG 21445 / STM815) TaxID=391038 RepID=B2JSD4_PARP8|nr:class I adenylate-forming enzyme family protein [Paraburkholderia phymatum]ACC73954.1 AMP-dependent synthetase and ligase [Paraburkholderia phymatum STM815]
MLTADIEAHALRDSARVAIRSGTEVLQYGELIRKVDRFVDSLRGAGVDSRHTVASLCDNRIEVLLLYYAMGKIGGTFISINQSLTAPEVAYILGHAEVSLLLHDERMELVAKKAAEDQDTVQVTTFEELIAAGSTSQVSTIGQMADNFMVAYTSGSTGRPKAVAFDQRSEVAGNRSLIEMWGMTPSDITLVALPLGFMYGLSTAASMTLQAGGEVVLLRRFHPREVLEALISHKATVFHGVPTMFAMMLEYAEQNSVEVDLSFMRLLVSAGAPLSRELCARFEAKFGKRIDDYYGLTEVRPVFGRYWNDSSPVPASAIGKAAPGVIVRIVDSNGNDVEQGETGEILVRAPSTTRGYFKNPELTESVFTGDGLLKTGDLGYRDTDGYYHLTGRIKDIIIRGGANIAPAEVEETIESHPDAKAVAVIGVPDEKFGQIVVAYVVPRECNHASEDEVREFCKGRLADFKVPAQIIWSEELPLGITGKVDKKALLARWSECHV